MRGLELLSTSLWQLKKDVELCFLSQEVVAFDRKSPQVWCVVGNCFSLQKEHTAAMKFFQRAIQLDPDFSYAYTLCGHEYISNEDFDKAVTFFRNAIRTHDRHYTAWFGVERFTIVRKNINSQNITFVVPSTSILDLPCCTATSVWCCTRKSNSRKLCTYWIVRPNWIP